MIKKFTGNFSLFLKNYWPLLKTLFTAIQSQTATEQNFIYLVNVICYKQVNSYVLRTVLYFRYFISFVRKFTDESAKNICVFSLYWISLHNIVQKQLKNSGMIIQRHIVHVLLHKITGRVKHKTSHQHTDCYVLMKCNLDLCFIYCNYAMVVTLLKQIL